MPTGRLVTEEESTSKRKNKDGTQLRYFCNVCKVHWGYEYVRVQRHEARCKKTYHKVEAEIKKRIKDEMDKCKLSLFKSIGVNTGTVEVDPDGDEEKKNEDTKS